jgi:hypothetical protein
MRWCISITNLFHQTECQQIAERADTFVVLVAPGVPGSRTSKHAQGNDERQVVYLPINAQTGEGFFIPPLAGQRQFSG